MKQLNLIPDSVRTKAVQAQLVPYVVIAVILAAGFVLAAAAAVRIQLDSAVERLSTVTATSTNATTTPAVTVDTDTASRVATLNTLAKFDVNWSEAYSVVQSIIPDAVQLSNFSYTSTTNGMDLKLSGTAPSSVAFASFVESLQGNKKLIAPSVTSFSYTPSTGAVIFSVDMTVPFSDLSYAS